MIKFLRALLSTVNAQPIKVKEGGSKFMWRTFSRGVFGVSYFSVLLNFYKQTFQKFDRLFIPPPPKSPCPICVSILPNDDLIVKSVIVIYWFSFFSRLHESYLGRALTWSNDKDTCAWRRKREAKLNSIISLKCTS